MRINVIFLISGAICLVNSTRIYTVHSLDYGFATQKFPSGVISSFIVVLLSFYGMLTLSGTRNTKVEILAKCTSSVGVFKSSWNLINSFMTKQSNFPIKFLSCDSREYQSWTDNSSEKSLFECQLPYKITILSKYCYFKYQSGISRTKDVCHIYGIAVFIYPVGCFRFLSPFVLVVQPLSRESLTTRLRPDVLIFARLSVHGIETFGNNRDTHPRV